jgi:hypothetical protein
LIGCAMRPSYWPAQRSWLPASVNTSAVNGGRDVGNANLPVKGVPTDPKDLTLILQRAQRGDEKTLPVLWELLKDSHMVEVYGNLAKHAENKLIEKLLGKDLAVSEGVRRKLVSLRAELSGASPTPLERLLIERIAVCWLHLYHLELMYAGRDDMTLELAMYYQKCIDRAHRRYLSAIKTLALVRKLALPVLQVNIAKKQVNVAGPCVPTDADRKGKGTSDA